MHKTQNRCNQKQHGGNTRCAAVDARFRGEAFATIALEFLPTCASEMGSHTRMRTGRITWAQLVLHRNVDTLQFCSVQTASVITTRSRSCCCVNSATVGDDCHAVLGADVLHIVPADFAIDYSVDNLDALVANYNFWSHVDQVRQTAKGSRPGQSAKNIVQVATGGLPNHSECNENYKAEKVVTTLRSENLNIAHMNQTTLTNRCIADHEEVAA